MDGPRKWRSEWPIWAAIVIVLALAYVGGYVFTVRQRQVVMANFGGILPGVLEPNVPDLSHYKCVRVYPRYSEDDHTHLWLQRMFFPIHQIDRRLHPNVWRMDAIPPEWGATIPF